MGRRSAPARKGRTERSVRLRALLSAGMVLGLGAVGTLAAWTDESTATATFSAGTLDLKLKTLPGNTFVDEVSETSLNMTDMYPGVSKAAVVQVSNSGTVPLSYTLTGSAMADSGDLTNLGDALRVEVRAGATVTGTPPTELCTGGTVIETAHVALNGPLISIPRLLVPADTEDLCLTVSLPSNAANELQGTGTTATFTFNASMGS